MIDRQRYECDSCGLSELLPESPTDSPRRLRKGCDRCGSIRSWVKVV